MRIAVNTRLLINNKIEGIGRFTWETLKILVTKHPEITFYFIFDRKPAAEFCSFPNVKPIVAYPQARHPFLWYLFFEYSIPHILNKLKPDLFISPDGWIPLNPKFKTLNVIHDLNFAHYPQFISKLTLKYYDFFFPGFARNSTRIATVSEYSKQDICKTYNLPPHKIDVVYNGVNSIFTPCNTQEQDQIKQTLTNNCNFFLFVGLIHPRKNLHNIIYAFEKFKRKYNTDIKLVIAGEKKWMTAEINNAYKNSLVKNEIIFTGRVSDYQLRCLYSATIALLYLSYFEGFGIPMIEAMSCGAPVIASDCTSLPEIAGNAALYAKPDDTDTIFANMCNIYSDNDLRKNRIEKGFLQKKLYSWEKTADLLWLSVEKCLNS